MPLLNLHHAFLVLAVRIRRLDGEDVFLVLQGNMLREPQDVLLVQQVHMPQRRLLLVQIALQVKSQALEQHHVFHAGQVNTHPLGPLSVKSAQQVHIPVELPAQAAPGGHIQALDRHRVQVVLQEPIQAQAQRHVAAAHQDHGQAEVLLHVLYAQRGHIQYHKEQLQPQFVLLVQPAIRLLQAPHHASLVSMAPMFLEELAQLAQQGHIPVMRHHRVFNVLQDNPQFLGLLHVLLVQQASSQSREALVPLVVLGLIQVLGLLHVSNALQGNIQALGL